jgi:hypothetical protein
VERLKEEIDLLEGDRRRIIDHINDDINALKNHPSLQIDKLMYYVANREIDELRRIIQTQDEVDEVEAEVDAPEEDDDEDREDEADDDDIDITDDDEISDDEG